MGSGPAPARLHQTRSSIVRLLLLRRQRQPHHQHQRRGPLVQLVEVSSRSAQTGAAQVATEARRLPCKTAKETGSAHRIYSAISGPLRLAERSTAPQTTQTAMTTAARRTTHQPLEASRYRAVRVVHALIRHRAHHQSHKASKPPRADRQQARWSTCLYEHL